MAVSPGVGRVGLRGGGDRSGAGDCTARHGDAQVISGEVLRKRIVQMEQHVTLSTDALAGEVVDTRVGRVRERGSRRAVKGPVDAREAQGRGRGVGEQLTGWYTQCVGASLLAYAQVGAGRRLHSVDCTTVDVPLDRGHDAWSGVVKNDDGSLARVLLSYSLYHLFTHTHAGTHVANKTREAIALEHLQTQRTHVIVSAGGYCEIFETLTFVHVVLGLPLLVQERLRLWLDEHLKHIEKLA